MDNALVAEWLRFANMDLDAAKNLITMMHPAPLEIICFHCQQAAEKFLKAVMLSFDIEIIKTHNLPLLITTLLEHIEIPKEIDEIAESLTPFATRMRYPLPTSVDEAQTKRAIAQAEKVKAWAESVLAKQSK